MSAEVLSTFDVSCATQTVLGRMPRRTSESPGLQRIIEQFQSWALDLYPRNLPVCTAPKDLQCCDRLLSFNPRALMPKPERSVLETHSRIDGLEETFEAGCTKKNRHNARRPQDFQIATLQRLVCSSVFRVSHTPFLVLSTLHL